jgi:hypothetical protein
MFVKTVTTTGGPPALGTNEKPLVSACSPFSMEDTPRLRASLLLNSGIFYLQLGSV